MCSGMLVQSTTHGKTSAGELLHTNFKADGLNVTLEEKRVKLAIGQESHASACDIELNNDVSRMEKRKMCAQGL